MHSTTLAKRFLAPALVFLGVFLVLPVLLGVFLSFFRIESAFAGFPYSFRFAGLSNYAAVLSNALFWNSALYSLVYTAGVTAGTLVLGIGGSMLLRRAFVGRSVVRTLMLLSWLVPTYIVGLLWGFLWQQDIGLVNRLLFDVLHIDALTTPLGVSWETVDGVLVRPRWFDGSNAAWAVAIPAVWHAWPFAMAMCLAARQAIPRTVYEAAEMDGVGKLEQFLYITLPLLRPALVALFVQNLVLNAYTFNIVVMLFGGGTGFPSKTADLILPYAFRLTFQQQSWNLGGGLAISTLVMTAMTIVLLASFRKMQQKLGES
jgi:multiple sugar transport system permease protein